MSKQEIKVEELDITVSRSWPLNRLKTVSVKVNDKSYGNSITLTDHQASTLCTALNDVLKLSVSEEQKESK